MRLAAVILAGLAASVSLQAARDRWYPEIASPVDELYFTNGTAVGRMRMNEEARVMSIKTRKYK